LEATVYSDAKPKVCVLARSCFTSLLVFEAFCVYDQALPIKGESR
jgi:hypothetical protein